MTDGESEKEKTQVALGAMRVIALLAESGLVVLEHECVTDGVVFRMKAGPKA